MSTQFASAIARLNSAVVARLSADVVSVGGVAVDAIFDNGYALGSVGLLGMASSQPALTLRTVDVPVDAVGTAAVVNGSNYLVDAHEPDGTGMSRLLLGSAA